MVYIYVFNNSVLVFICKLANQRNCLFTDFTAIYMQVRKSRKEYCCVPLLGAAHLVGYQVLLYTQGLDVRYSAI
jgi:hypothetical protein